MNIDLNGSADYIFSIKKEYPSILSYCLLKYKIINTGNIKINKSPNQNRSTFHVGIIGMDGAGKSTLTASLKNYFSKSIKCESIYLGQYRGYDVKIYRRIFLRIVKIFFRKKIVTFIIYSKHCFGVG